MKKAILCVSFGTSIDSARCSIDAVENVFKSAYPDYVFLSAFTSSIIRSVLKKRGETVMSVSEALDYLYTNGIKEIFVQPTHILYGNEYDKIKSEILPWQDKFDSLVLGEPLLANSKDLVSLASSLSCIYQPSDNEALVLFGHGTNHFANASYGALQTAFRLIERDNVFVGTVEGWPTLDDIISQLKRTSFKKVCIVPLMLVAGDHALNDMAGNEDSWKTILENQGFEVRCIISGLGTLKAVQNMYLSKLKKII